MDQPRIAILSAMQSEVADLLTEIQIDESASMTSANAHGMRDYWAGTLWGTPVVLAWSRWGKVAAAATTAHVIGAYEPKEIVFVGVAGSLGEAEIGDVVIASSLVQHDLDASPLFPRHEVPLLGVSRFETDPDLRARLVTAAGSFLSEGLGPEVGSASLDRLGTSSPRVLVGQVASGDQFIADPVTANRIRNRLPESLCVEMEGAAVAQVCFEHDVPLAVMRTISDRADGTAHVDFPAFLDQVASTYSHGVLQRYLHPGGQQLPDDRLGRPAR